MLEKFKSIFLQNRSIKQTMFKNIFWLTMSQVSRLLRIAILLYAARLLGATEYGIFAYVLSTIGLFSIFADMGINPLLTRDAAGEPQMQKEYFVTSFWIKILLITVTSFVFFVSIPYLTKVQAVIYLIPLAVALIILDNIKDFIVAYLRGIQKMERETFIITILNISLAIFGFMMLLISPTAKDFFSVYVASSALATIVAIIIARNALFHIFTGFRKKIALEIFKNGWPIALSGAFGMLMLNVDIFMLGWFSTSSEIGLYAAGQKIIQVLYTAPALLASGIFPAMAYMVKSGNVNTEKNLNEKSLSIVLMFTIPLIVGGIILAKPLLGFVFGSGYVGGAMSFTVLLLSALFTFPGIILANLVLAHNQQKKMVRYVIFAALTNIILNILLIPKIGIIGAAFATFIAQMINYSFVWYQMKKINNFEVFPHTGKIFISAIAMGVISITLNTLQVQVLVNIAISACLYLALLIVMKEKMLSEIKALLSNLSAVDVGQEVVK